MFRIVQVTLPVTNVSDTHKLNEDTRQIHLLGQSLVSGNNGAERMFGVLHKAYL